MNKPNQQTVREIARTAVSYVIRDHLVQAAMAEHGISADNVYAWSEIYDAVLDTIAAGVQEPDEQQAADPLLAEVKCGRECSEMHTFEQGSCEAAVTAEQQQDGAAEELCTFLAALPPRIDIVADWTRGGVRNVLTAEALRAVLAERTALAAQVAELKSEREVRYECPACGRTDVSLTKAGRMRSHSGDIWIGGYRQVCKGVGELPKPAPETEES